MNTARSALTQTGLHARATYLPVFRLLGIAGTVFGTCIAYAVVPVDPTPAGALCMPALLQATGLLLAPLLAVIRNPASIFRAENTIPCGVVYWLLIDLVQGTYDVPVDQDAVQLAFVAIGVFVTCFWIATIGGQAIRLPGVLRTVSAQDPSASTLFWAITAAFGLAFLRYAIPSNFDPIAMFEGLRQARFSAPWSRGALGGWDAFVDHLSYFGYVLPTLTVIIAHRIGRWFDLRIIASVFMCLIITAFYIQSGSRRIVGTIYGASVMCWILLQADRAKLGTYLRLIGMIGTLLLLMQVMLEFRGEGVLEKMRPNEAVLQHSTLRVDDNFLRLSEIIDWFPDRVAFVEHRYIVWVIIRPIPRALWPDKPIDPGFDHGEEAGKRGTSLTSSVVGESFMSYGWFGVAFVGIIYGTLAGVCSQILTSSTSASRVALYGLAAMPVFAGLRSMIELVLMSYMLLAWIVLSVVIGSGGSTATSGSQSLSTSTR